MFEDRIDAGEQLAEVLDGHDVEADVVLAVPRGGLPVGRVVADALGARLDVVVAKKIGSPHNPELAIGAVAGDGSVWLNDSLVDDLDVDDDDVEERIAVEREAAAETIERYRAGRQSPELSGKTVVVVDDGIATGATMMACVRQVKDAGAERVIVAVPVAPPSTVEQLLAVADEVLCVETPPHFGAVGQFYRSFEQVSDDEAMGYLSEDT